MRKSDQQSEKGRVFGVMKKDFDQLKAFMLHCLCVSEGQMAEITASPVYKSLQRMVNQISNRQTADMRSSMAIVAVDGTKEIVAQTLRLEEMKHVIGYNFEFMKEISVLVAFLKAFYDSKPLVADTLVREGYMYKQGGKHKNWKRRWFALNGLFMFYYTNQQRTNHKGTIVLEECNVLLAPEGIGMTRFSFKIETSNRTFVLSCDSGALRDEWMESIGNLKQSFAGKVLFPSPLSLFSSFLSFFASKRIRN